MRNIFLTENRLAEWRGLIAANDPTALAILKTLRLEAEQPQSDAAVGPDPLFDAPECALATLCLAWIEQDKALAADALRQLEAWLAEDPRSDLGKAGQALTAVLAWDFGSGLWDESARRRFAGTIRTIALSFLEVTRGNPHTVTNNWWMLTHGGCLLACIAADGEAGVDGSIDLADLRQWALHRFRAFCAHFGSAGLYHEGSGYIAYTLSMLMPALYAVQRHLAPGILDEFPQLRRSIPSMLVGTAAITHTDNGAGGETFGASLQWNDAGRGCLNLNPCVPGMAVAPEEWRGALRTVFDRLLGVEGGNTWNCTYRGTALAVALYPFSATREDPEPVLPKWIWDQRQGLGMWRSAWGDGGESVFGWYARATHAGGHAQDDAASIRLIAAGRTWICSGGQARPHAEWQSVFTHADRAERPRPAPLAHITCSHLHAGGGVVGIDTRQSLTAYSERYLAWRGDFGHPFCLAVMDLLDEHKDPPRSWQWNLSFPRELAATVHPDQRGFTLEDPQRRRLSARFMLDQPDRLELGEMPGSSRTYANGRKVDYPGDRFIHAAYGSRKAARILVALVVSTGGAAPVIEFAANAIRIDGREWQHPFFPAVLKTVDLAASRPNRMTDPGG